MLVLALLFAGQLSFADQNHPTDNLSKLLPSSMQPTSAKSDFQKAMEKAPKGDDEGAASGAAGADAAGSGAGAGSGSGSGAIGAAGDTSGSASSAGTGGSGVSAGAGGSGGARRGTGPSKTCVLPVPKIPLKSGQNPTDVHIPNPPVPQGPKFPITNPAENQNCLDRGGSIQYATPTAGH